MKIYWGSGRIAITTSKVTVKLPRVKLYTFYKDVCDLLISRDAKFIAGYFTAPTEAHRGFKASVIKGLIENRVEAKSSKSLRDLAVPTILSLFGIVNIQATADPNELPGMQILDAIWSKIKENLDARTYYLFYNCSHTLGKGRNYGIHNGRLKLLDYGSKSAVQFMLENRESMRFALDEAHSVSVNDSTSGTFQIKSAGGND